MGDPDHEIVKAFEHLAAEVRRVRVVLRIR
jgi:hypothetical protein